MPQDQPADQTLEPRDAAGFYRSLGFTEDDSVSMGKRLVDD